MCGIAGFLGDYPEELLGAYVKALSHRGPDGDGVYYEAESGVGLAHTRLAIQDLSDAGQQPMGTSDGRNFLVYNGEIYNAPVLREGLMDRYEFRGTSDSEVLLAGVSLEGIDFVKKLNGIYAFAWWSEEAKSLYLVRDWMGVKPLYYAKTPRGLVFASEIKALLHVADLDTEVDAVAAGQYLTYLYTPGERTMFKGVKKLPPGSFMRCAGVKRAVVRNDKLTLREEKLCKPCSTEEAFEGLDRAVKRQLLSDVPVGAFLSGGFDSSAIVYSAGKVQTYTIDEGKEVGGDGFAGDLPYARGFAEEFGNPLEEVKVMPSMLEDLESLVWNLDEPQADPAALNALYISRRAREMGYKVLLSGAGGDDLFAGYRRHVAWSYDKFAMRVPRGLRMGAERLGGLLNQRSPRSRRVAKLLRGYGGSSRHRACSYYEWLAAERVAALGGGMDVEEVRRPFFEAWDSVPNGVSRLDQMLYLDCKFFLTDHNLNYTDKMGMAEGVEVRVPFLDRDLVNLAFSIPPSEKLQGRRGKHIIKEGYRERLPDGILDRPKTGFGVPLRSWFEGDGLQLLDELTSEGVIKSRGIFDFEAVRGLHKATKIGAADGAYTLLAVACVEIWCQKFLGFAGERF